jgi:hypothetical protein
MESLRMQDEPQNVLTNDVRREEEIPHRTRRGFEVTEEEGEQVEADLQRDEDGKDSHRRASRDAGNISCKAATGNGVWSVC